MTCNLIILKLLRRNIAIEIINASNEKGKIISLSKGADRKPINISYLLIHLFLLAHLFVAFQFYLCYDKLEIKFRYLRR